MFDISGLADHRSVQNGTSYPDTCSGSRNKSFLTPPLVKGDLELYSPSNVQELHRSRTFGWGKNAVSPIFGKSPFRVTGADTLNPISYCPRCDCWLSSLTQGTRPLLCWQGRPLRPGPMPGLSLWPATKQSVSRTPGGAADRKYIFKEVSGFAPTWSPTPF